jgi:hypothetical protein
MELKRDKAPRLAHTQSASVAQEKVRRLQRWDDLPGREEAELVEVVLVEAKDLLRRSSIQPQYARNLYSRPSTGHLLSPHLVRPLYPRH